MRLTDRTRLVLAAILLLPEGPDGWRRGTYRDQLHEGVPGLSRDQVNRAFASGDLEGLATKQGVGRSARLPEGYRLSPEGETLARQTEPHQTAPARTSSPHQPAPVLVDSSLPLSPKEDREKPRSTTDWSVSGAHQPAAPALSTRLTLDEQTLSVLYAAMTQTPLCACMRPMHAKQQAKSGAWFWACMFGRQGCSQTLPMRWQPKAAQSQRPQGSIERGKGQEPRDQSQLSLADVLRRTADQRRA